MIPHDPRHLGVPSSASKMISEPMVRSAPTVHPSRVKISTISKRQNELPLEPLSLGVPSGASKTISDPMVHWYIWCKPCTYLASTLTPSLDGPKQDST